MRVVPNLLDQYRKAFQFLRGEFPSGTLITIVRASDGVTRRHAVALPPRCKRATRTLMPHIRGTVPGGCTAPRARRSATASMPAQLHRNLSVPRHSERIIRMVRLTKISIGRAGARINDYVANRRSN